MSIFHPSYSFGHVRDISPEFVRRLGVTTLILDVDNTLTVHNSPVPGEYVMDWLDSMKAAGIHMVILSNNMEQRVEPFARRLGLDYTASAMKPLPGGFRRTAKRLGVSKEEMAIVGDQIFTDVLGANIYGCKSILVEPMATEGSWGFRLKRRLEAGIRKSALKRQEKSTGGNPL